MLQTCESVSKLLIIMGVLIFDRNDVYSLFLSNFFYSIYELSDGNTIETLLNSLRTTLRHVFKFVKLRQFLRLKKNFNVSGIPAKGVEVSYDRGKTLEPFENKGPEVPNQRSHLSHILIKLFHLLVLTLNPP